MNEVLRSQRSDADSLLMVLRMVVCVCGGGAVLINSSVGPQHIPLPAL